MGCRKGSGKAKPSEAAVGAVAKLIVQPKGNGTGELNSGALDDFYDFQIKILKSPELAALAAEKADAAKLGSAPAPVSLKIARMPGNPIVTLIGTSDSPEFARAWLDALIQAYALKVQGVIADENELKARSESIRGRKATAESALKEAEKNLTLFKLDHDATSEMEKTIAEKKLKRLKSASAFFQSELNLMAKSDLETDLQRRKASLAPPADMPEDFLRLLNTNLSPNEQAYLEALGRNDAATTKATKILAESDQKARIDSFNMQLSTANQLAVDLDKRLKEMEANEAMLKQLSAAVQAASLEYEALKQKELKADGVPNANEGPGVLVEIIQRPSEIETAK
jgi:hypothetical protein